MNDKELSSIIKLLDDPDENIYTALHHKLLDAGTVVIPQLEEAWERAQSEILQQRIESIIQVLQFSDIKAKLRDWKEKRQENLLEGAFIIAKFQYPELELRALLEKVEAIKREVWIELNNNLTALEKVKVINHILFKILGFKRNVTNPYSPQNALINDIIDTKKGNQVSLAILYAIIAQELNLPVYGVDLPHAFILGYQDEFDILQSAGNSNNVLFYINPYNKGAVFGKREIDYFLKQQKIDPLDEFYAACTNAISIEKLVYSLIESFEKLGHSEKVKQLNLLLTVLKGD